MMGKTYKKLLLAALFLGAGQAQALVVPERSPLDGRIQTVTYSTDNVVKVTAKVGHAVLIQLEEDERLEGDSAALGMGDAEGWSLAVKGNNIIFKPIVERSDTNLIITTNKRTYVFQLSVNDKAKYPTYVLRFHYPDTVLKQKNKIKKEREQAMNLVLGRTESVVHKANQNYWGYGDRALAPTALFDDGRFTYFDFNNGRELPAIYKKMPDGTESLVNSHVEGSKVVVHETARHFVLRLGQSVLGIENRGFDEQGSFNRLGTSTPGTVRIVK
ncbi:MULTISPECIES: P-type conjugative transfer protein VirB9 [Paenalcaligenes]|uniref:TrbG/VirB9 family P-type conjugative transfer protein n=1 Tax=Paenalcaligenes hermetiae TaxID=1157987 RepID=A0ABP9M8U5_9BURK|nr:P-type conjugative transfer protein VirB9 [Paenalcaligenes sp.]